jgi:DNA-binding Lrp family transcriptional regulator
VLLCLAETPDIRIRDVAERVGITERAAQRILADLVEAGYVKTTRVGRRNHYTLDREHAMRHTAQVGYEVGALLEALPRNSHPDDAEIPAETGQVSPGPGVIPEHWPRRASAAPIEAKSAKRRWPI